MVSAHDAPAASVDRVFQFAGGERQALHLGHRLGVDQVLGAHDAAQLTEVELGHDHLREPLQHLAEVRSGAG